MADPRASLTIGGKVYDGWTGVSVDRSIETLTGSFELEIAAREFTGAPRWPLRTGEACTVQLDGETVISGHIDSFDPDFDADGYSIRVAGRDRSADLVDCSAIAKPGSWTQRSIEAIAAELAKPFGITVTARTDTGAKVKRFALQQGETVFSAIERLARYRGLLAVTDAEGNVELIRPGTGAIVAELVEGVNILGGSASHDAKERFSDYIVKGQASGDDRANGKAVSAVKAEARDPAIGRYRPMLIVGEEQSTIAELRKRATWEATTRAGRSQSVTIPVPGWRTPSGALWKPNVRVSVSSPLLHVEGVMLVSGVRQSKEEGRGTVTDLTLMPPEAFSLLPVREDADASAVGRS